MKLLAAAVLDVSAVLLVALAANTMLRRQSAALRHWILTVAILSALAFGVRVDVSRVETQSARTVTSADFDSARRHGGTIRQLAHAEYDHERAALTAWVAPTVVPRGSVFARTVGPQNAAVISGVHAGDVAISGAGAGGDATAVAVISDILAIARDRAAVVPAPALSVPRVIVGLGPRPGIADLRVQSSDSLEAEAV